MDSGASLTRATVWIALTLYAAGECARAACRGHERIGAGWWLNCIGCVFFLAHVASAFHHHYDWSHALAYADTARQAREFAGWNSGSGLYLNYAFALVWVVAVVWSAATRSFKHSKQRVSWAVRFFFLFMIFNGAFVFVRNDTRWFGLLLCVILIGCWWFERKRGIDPRRSPKSS
jgi:hypothetical protein